MNQISNITTTPSIFSNFEKFDKNPIYATNINKSSSDTFEKQTDGKSKKKKLIIAGAAIGAVAIASIVFFKCSKNGESLVKKIKDSIQPPKTETTIKLNRPIPKTADEYCETSIMNAKKFLIDYAKEDGVASINGLGIEGPDSIGKEEAIKDILDSLEEAGYVIDKIPRVGDTNIRVVCQSIYDSIKKAEARFKETKQHTAIVVRDIDKIARERTKFHEYNAISPLSSFENCSDRGYSWIGIAEAFTDVDGAVTRGGRMEHFIFCRPSIKDSKEVWEKYTKALEIFRTEKLKQVLLEDAAEKMKNLIK